VLSCRHVLEPYLTSADDNAYRSKGGAERAAIQIRQADRSSTSAWVDCAIAWQHPTRDLVLLQITPRSDQPWDSPRQRSPRLAGPGERPSDCVAIGFPDAEARPAGLRDSEQAPGRLLPAGAARDPDGLVPFDVATSVPDDAELWKGFSGSAIFDEQNRLVGLVVKAHPARQQRRLLVVLIEDAATDPAFAAAAAAVGLDPTVEDHLAPLWRQCVEPRALTATGIPPTVVDVEDMQAFGVYGPSSAPARGSVFDYVKRDKDAAVEAALTEARSGGCRVVLIAGDSAAGKSRSALEAVRRDPVLRCWRLVVPLSDGGLSQLARAELGWQDTVLWLDDLDKYLGRGLDLGILRRILGDDPSVVLVATMRTSQLQVRQSQLADPAWGFLTDESQVTRVDLEASLSDDEIQTASAKISDASLLSALQDGVGLGEWLVAGPELMKKLNDGRGLNRALADTVIAWYRTRLNQPLGKEDARRFWALTLPLVLRQRLISREPSEQSELFEQACAWACQPVLGRDLYEQALVTKLADGYVANDYVVDQTVRDPKRIAVPDPIWQLALQVASTNLESDQKPGRLWEVGNAAYREQAFEFAQAAIQTLADAGVANAQSNEFLAVMRSINELLDISANPPNEAGVLEWWRQQAASCVQRARALGEPVTLAQALEAAARIQLAAGDPAAAVPLLEEEFAHTVGHDGKLATDQAILAAAGLAKVQLQLQNFAHASHAAGKAIELIEQDRYRVNAPLEQAAFLAPHVDVFTIGVFSAWKLGDYDTMLQRMELSKARASIQQLFNEPGTVSVRDSADLPGPAAELDSELREVTAAIHQPASAAEEHALRVRRLQLWELRAAARRDPAAATPVVTVAGIQSLLGPDEAIVHYYWLRPRVLLIVTITSVGIAVDRSVLTQEDRAKLDAFIDVLSSIAGSNGDVDAAFIAPLLMPAGSRRMLQGKERLVVSPHGVLRWYPFAAMPYQGGPLVRTFALRQVPNLTSLLVPRGVSGPARVAGIAVSEFPDREATLPPLPEASPGASQIAAMYAAAGVPTKVMFEPTRAELIGALMDDTLTGAWCLHLATRVHSIADDISKGGPLESTLELADGSVDGYEIAAASLGSEVVVLTSCDAGQLAIRSRSMVEQVGDELSGLHAAFFESHCGSVLAPLWPSDESTISRIVIAFHGNLAHYAPPDIALAQAQREFLNTANDKERGAYYWASLVLTTTGRLMPRGGSGVGLPTALD
jgi:CHAT domain-containing protein